jgi:hypothetical protein
MEFLRDESEGVLPGDGLVVVAAGAEHNGLREAALVAEPVVGLLRELRDAPLGEEFERDAFRSGFLGDGFGAVFTILVGGAMVVGIGPGTAGTIDAAKLIEACCELAFALGGSRGPLVCVGMMVLCEEPDVPQPLALCRTVAIACSFAASYRARLRSSPCVIPLRVSRSR